MAKTEFKTVAKLTVHGINKMAEKDRRDIAEWLKSLKRLARSIVCEGKDYPNKVFTARYQVPVRKG